MILSTNPDKERPPASARGPLDLVIVDTDPRIGRAFARFLTSADLPTSVTRVADVAAANAVAASHVPDLVALTLGPAAKSGDLAAIAQMSVELAVPVIAISARDGLRGPALRQGAAAFIHYGMAPDEVLEIIQRTLKSLPAKPSLGRN